MKTDLAADFAQLSNNFEGELFFDESSYQHNAMRLIYATDASVYQEKPVAVAIPKNVADLQKLIAFANQTETTLIPRAAGTSLAGQVVGSGVVVDISKHFTKIIEVNQVEKWVRVQPGVIRNDLNAYLKPYGLLFGPETSTASRAMIGGMIGNNSCGLHSIVWGDVRANLLEVKALLSDGSEVKFSPLTRAANRPEGEIFKRPTQGLEAEIYNKIFSILSDSINQSEIRTHFPKKEITRRNTGYALDALLDNDFLTPSSGAGEDFNLCNLIAGSEGTLCFVTEAKLKLLDLPPPEIALVNVHCQTMRESLMANLVALKHNCYASELMDDVVLSFTEGNIEQTKNRSFVEGNPKTILMVEFFANTSEILKQITDRFIADLQSQGLGYAYPILRNEETTKAWELRKSALGLLSNQKGDFQPANLIEDCAVSPEDLPDYIDEIEALLQKHNLIYSITAHAGAGELHVIPIMNLRTSEGRVLFREILAETAVIVKKYRGSLSGEHGDGRLRGEFLPFMMGDRNYELFKEVKAIFDPKGVFNRGKITDTPPMNAFLRVEPDQIAPKISTIFDFTAQEGILRLAEKCSGSGDCRKTEITGGTMCPSYMATRQEKDTTRARANMLRHYYNDELRITNYESGIVNSELGVKQVLDLCLSCKGCKAECPSSVDVGKMKAEFMQHYYDTNGVPFRTKLIGNYSKMMRLASLAPWTYNFVFKNAPLRKIANKLVGFHPDRTMPLLAPLTLQKEGSRQKKSLSGGKGAVFLFLDEFTKYNDGEIAHKLISMLQRLDYEVVIPKCNESGRAYLSKGMVRDAQKIAIENVLKFKDIITDDTPLVGIEPSAILTFRDEYIDLVPPELKEAAQQIAKNCFLFEEWFAREIDRKNINKSQFTDQKRLIKLHGHCHQKALSSLTPSKKILSLPQNYEVQLIPSGCCGMAGSFGYEVEHYDLSMQIGELVLFPTVRKQAPDTIIAAAGTSCRHQIKDGTGRIAQHPIEILYEALV
jgi:FAD/FMN-containing dehydrogenase/Fe-S oxidoreductase